jgi:predicted Fe-Mo cluster-binding NifX family protein
MKLGLPSSGKEMDTFVDPRFGRCRYFMVVDPDTLSFEARENPFRTADRGAGIQAAQWMADQCVNTVMVGRVGPNALKVLKRAGITVISGIQGKISVAVEIYRAGELVNPATIPETSDNASSFKKEARRGLGPGGKCVCPRCATSIEHRRGVPCREEACPKCKAKMRRE